MAESTIDIKINTSVNTTESVKNITDLKKAISNLESDSNLLDFGSEAFEKSKTQIDDLKNKLTQLGKSQEQLSKELGQQAEQNAKQNAEKIEKIGNNLQKFAAGLTDAFAGAFIAFGASDKDAEEFNKTLQQGIGIAVGVKGAIEALVSGVELAGPAFEVFNAVMAANPAVVIVAAIAALAAGIYLLVKALSAEKSESEKLTEAFEEQKVAAEQLSKARKSEISVMEAKLNLMKAQGKSDAEILKATKDLYTAKKAALEQDVIQLEMAANITKAKLVEALATETLWESTQKALAATYRATGQSLAADVIEKSIAEGKKERQKEITDQLLKDLTAVKEAKDNIAKLDIDRAIAVAEVENGINEKRTKNNEDQKKEYDKLLAEEKIRGEKRFEELKKQSQDEIDLEKKRIQELISVRNAEYDTELFIQEAKNKAKLTAAELETFTNKNSLDSQLKFLETKRKIELDNLALTEEERKLINAKYKEEEEKLRDADEKATIESFDKKVQSVNKYVQAIGGVLNSVVGVFQAISDLQRQQEEQDTKERQAKLDADISNLETAKEMELAKEGLTAEQKVAIQQKFAQQEYELKLDEYNKSTEIKKKAFEQEKKLKIATAIINTITGAVAAFAGAMSLGPIAGPIVGGLLAAAVVATGAIQVAAIEKQKFDAGTPPTAPKVSIPSTNIGSSGGGNNNATDANLYKVGKAGQNSGQNMNQEPIQAYVVSQDVTTAQDKAAVIERRSTF